MKKVISMLLVASSLLLSMVAEAKDTVRILTDRSDFHLKSITEQYGKDNGVDVEVLFIDEGLIARMQGRNDADVIISKNSSEVINASALGLLAKLPKGFNAPIGNEFVGNGGDWFNMSYRLRSFIFSKDLKEYPKSYEELADPKYAGQICIRSLSHNYNLELVSFMIAKHGEEYVKQWLAGLKSNLARKPTGNDRDQAKAIFNGECKIGVVNTYYMGLMLENAEQRNWAHAVNLFVPNQDADGSLTMFSAVAVTKKGSSNKAVAKLLSYLVNPVVQQYMSSINYEYPVIGVSGSAMVKSFGDFQKLKPEEIKRTKITQEQIAKHRATALKLVSLM